MKMNKEPIWLRLSQLENAIDNLEMAAYFLENIESEIKWKWSVIALHQALYGFAISASSGLIEKTVTKPSKKFPDGELIPIWRAINLTKESSESSLDRYEPLVLSVEEEWSIKKLVDEFRNGFEHFSPGLWSIEISGMPKIFTHIIRVIRFLAIESKRINSSFDDEKRISIALKKIETYLKNR